MDFKDLALLPLYLVIIYFMAFNQLSSVPKDSPIRKYFLPALTIKIIGGICAGLIYQFYYNQQGDTFTYFHDSTIIWDAFTASPVTGLRMIFMKAATFNPELYQHTWRMHLFFDDQSFFVVRITAILGLLTFNTYLLITLLFTFLSFTGVWALYKTFTDIYPQLHKEMAISIFFIPSVFFWGSGLFKDTVTFGSLGWVTYSVYHLLIKKTDLFRSAIFLVICGFLIFKIKPYIILALIPGMLFWIIAKSQKGLKSQLVRNLLTPIGIIVGGIMGYLILEELGKEFQKYSMKNFMALSQQVQSWHAYLSDLQQGSAYSLGVIDPTPMGALKKMPAAVNVTLFRPYIWEAKNAVMLLSAIEALGMLIFTIRVIMLAGIMRFLRIIWNNPEVFFAVFFTILFAFAIGFSTYNFGALVRYKIPCIPFLMIALFIIRHTAMEEDRLAELQAQEAAEGPARQ